LIFFFALPVSSGKFGKQFLRFRAAKPFFFGITVFLYQNKNPVAPLDHWKKKGGGALETILCFPEVPSAMSSLIYMSNEFI
jgi:hypothetical protein